MFSKFTQTQLKKLLENIFDSNPLLHAMAMLAKMADTFNFTGIYRDAIHDPVEQERRLAWRKSFRLRWVSVVLLIWKYKLNVDPDYEVEAEKLLFKKFKNLCYTKEHREIFEGKVESVEMVPIHDIAHLYGNKIKSPFDLKLEGWPEAELDEEASDDWVCRSKQRYGLV